MSDIKKSEQQMIAEARQKALNTAIADIEKKFGKGSIMSLGKNEGMSVETISTGSFTLDLALGVGGIPKGRVVEIYGPESSGKTTVALHMIAEAQRAGGTAAFIPIMQRISVSTSILSSSLSPMTASRHLR